MGRTQQVLDTAGCEELPFVQTWKQVLKKRGALTLIWVVGAAIVAGIVGADILAYPEEFKLSKGVI